MILISGALRIFSAKHLLLKRRRNGSQSYSNTSDLCWWQWESTLLETEGWVRMETRLGENGDRGLGENGEGIILDQNAFYASFPSMLPFAIWHSVCYIRLGHTSHIFPIKLIIWWWQWPRQRKIQSAPRSRISNMAFPPKCSLIFSTQLVPPTMFHKIFPPKICHQNFPQLFNILFCNFDPE